MNKQADHYNRIIEAYDEGYFDEFSVKYREMFIYGPLFHGLDFSDKTLLEIGCGSGLNTKWLKTRYPTLRCYGVDVSEKAIERYHLYNPESEGFVFDLTKSGPVLDRKVDYCLGIGVLHHCVKDLGTTIDNIHSSLEDNGHLLLFEPNGYGLINTIRNIWYRFDDLFDEENEKALGVGDISRYIDGKFEIESVNYFGGVAYFLILNSSALRIPLAIKRILFPWVMALEKLLSIFNGKYVSPAYLLKLRKIN